MTAHSEQALTMETDDGAADFAPPAVASDHEIPFGMDELFFSRTDRRGRILSGNDVFQRVSQYSWAEMIERPHNIIRHPDMPRAVFHILWERIRAGQPVGAYVKNRSQDGGYYWVFAVVTPVEDGYLSVRLKPSSALFAAASRLYASIRAQERASEAKPADSARTLTDNLRESGFRDYAAFMAAALAAETQARDAALGRPPWPALERYEALVEAAGVLMASTGRMLDLTSSFRYTPGNLRIQAARLGEEGRAIAEISVNYVRISEAIVDNLQAFHAAAAEVSCAVNEGLFLACTARLQDETARFFSLETSGHDEAREGEALRLMRQTQDYTDHAARTFDLIKTHVAHFVDLTREMKRLASGLVAVRVMGKVESVGMYDGIFRELIGDLERGQETLSAGLSDIAAINNRITDTIEHLDDDR